MKIGYPDTKNKLGGSPLYQTEPPKKKYKTGEWISQDKILDNPDQFPAFNEAYSEIQEDKKGQYVTTIDDIGSAFETTSVDKYPSERKKGMSGFKPSKEAAAKRNMELRKRTHIGGVARDTVRPKKGKRFKKQKHFLNIK